MKPNGTKTHAKALVYENEINPEKYSLWFKKTDKIVL